MRWCNLAELQKEKQILEDLRKQIFTVGYRGGMAHLASCYSCLEILYTLYFKDVLHYDKKNIKHPDRDRLILSKGHGGLALYAILAKAGIISQEELNTYLQPGTHIGGEPSLRDAKGVEASTGSLGHGLGIGVGIALGQKIDNTEGKTYVIVGDGELEEGANWEAAMIAPQFKLNNLVVILDCNEIQKMDSVSNTIGNNNWKEKWESFGWQVAEVDGHDVAALQNVLTTKPKNEKPVFIIAHTIKGKGVSIMENNPNWHFKLPNKKELKVFVAELNISSSEVEEICKKRT